MLILCLGPDTFRAQMKAQELELAFKQKYDPTGSSVEHLSLGKEAADEVIERANTGSLFSPRRFLRTTDLLADCPKAKVTALAQALTRDPENVIAVSVEAEPLSTTELTSFSKVKIIKYEFPEQRGKAFQLWLEGQAKKIGVENESAIAAIAEATEGDSWYAWNELLKLAASGTSDLTIPLPQPTIFDYVDRYLAQGKNQRDVFQNQESSSQFLLTLISQTRAALRIRDGATHGLHPYVVKKIGAAQHQDLEQIFAVALSALFSQRAGLAADHEVANLL
ncbi:hypothetical protein EXS71_02390 [Candidatus Uhrbacteria bacterium]|nr:hypothetical protein [Candidatus Uhrbacteria bacterium]